jgi:hypothetical protein
VDRRVPESRQNSPRMSGCVASYVVSADRAATTTKSLASKRFPSTRYKIRSNANPQPQADTMFYKTQKKVRRAKYTLYFLHEFFSNTAGWFLWFMEQRVVLVVHGTTCVCFCACGFHRTGAWKLYFLCPFISEKNKLMPRLDVLNILLS